MIRISLSVMGVKAGDTCKITENKLTQDKITADCRIVEISEDTTIDSGVTIEIKDKIVILDNGKTLTVEGILNIKDFKPQTGDLEKVKAARGEAGYTDKIDSTNVIFEENSKLAIKGTVNSTNAADEGCNGVVEGSASSCPIAFQTMKKSGSPFGEIEVNGGNLKIDGFKRGGIAPIRY